MKKLLALALALCMALSLAGCGGTPSSTPASTPASTGGEPASTPADSEAFTETVTLKIANYALLEEGYTDFWEGVKTGFEAKYPNITIEWVTAPYGEIVNQVINMAGGGDKVDMIFGEIGWIPTLEDAGLTVPVTDVLTADYLADFYDSVLDGCKIGGEIYGLPMYTSPYVLYYNKDLFTQAGLDPNAPPTTYDEMLEMAGKLAKLKTADGNKVYPFGQTTASVAVSGSAINAMVYNFGGTVLAPDGTLSIDNQGFKDAITMLQELDKKGYNPQNAKLKDLRQLFATGQLAMYYDQSWGFNGVQSINPEAKNFAATAKPLKGGSGNGASMLQAHILAYMDNGENQKTAARLFTEYLVTADQLQDYMTNITPAYPATKSMESMALNPVLEGAAGAIENLTTTPFIPTLGDLNLELCTLAQDVTVGGTDVDKAIESFRTAASNIIG
ncbi:ABC transporter substrate-binding protein [Allofournierella sp.]|uniref:ABC transporter substrate-binding protein n=1 Tax=Allofournierella sp. TaxID=1940256 RepID=UPI003AB78303